MLVFPESLAHKSIDMSQKDFIIFVMPHAPLMLYSHCQESRQELKKNLEV